ncbi:MAG: hypothetical protein ABIO72_02660 [Patescibacteria group bacterium]
MNMPRKLTSILGILAFVVTAAAPLATNAAPNGSLIKSNSNSAVYYLADGKRYAFPNEKVFFSWYSNFNGVLIVSENELASYSLSGNVTYRPGVKLIKIQTDPKVYAVSRYGILRWLTSESAAASLYGSAWNKNVDDVADTFFINYSVGTSISVAADYSKDTELATTAIAQNIQGATVPPPPVQNTSVPVVGGCQMFPANNAWNQRVDSLSVRSDSATFISSIGMNSHLHPDFGEDPTYGIPFTVVPQGQARVPITWTAYGEESDPGPYPIPANAPHEQANDSHVLVIEQGDCKLYELYAAHKNTSDNGWSADSGAIWDLKTGALRPAGWTSADAAGLPILPGLVRYDEVAAGAINHAIRFTVSQSQRGYILPATHFAGSNNNNLAPMGLRVRLKANYDISNLTGQAKVIAEAMKKYGMIVADNGSNWYFQGGTDSRWNDDELNGLKNIPGSAFEAVDTGPIVH